MSENLTQEENTDSTERLEPLYLERDGGIATVVINRPKNRNSVTFEIWQALPALFNELSGDDTVRCIILRGAGGLAFSAGCDITEFAALRANKQQGIIYGRHMAETLAAIQACRHPVVARV